MLHAQHWSEAGLNSSGRVTVVLIANIGRAPWEALERRFSFDGPPFLPPALSYREGIRKPDRRLFALALERVGVPVGSMVYLDGSLSNVAAAKHIGLGAIRLGRLAWRKGLEDGVCITGADH